MCGRPREGDGPPGFDELGEGCGEGRVVPDGSIFGYVWLREICLSVMNWDCGDVRGFACAVVLVDLLSPPALVPALVLMVPFRGDIRLCSG